MSALWSATADTRCDVVVGVRGGRCGAPLPCEWHPITELHVTLHHQGGGATEITAVRDPEHDSGGLAAYVIDPARIPELTVERVNVDRLPPRSRLVIAPIQVGHVRIADGVEPLQGGAPGKRFERIAGEDGAP